jgi:hypothetical protein
VQKYLLLQQYVTISLTLSSSHTSYLHHPKLPTNLTLPSQHCIPISIDIVSLLHDAFKDYIRPEIDCPLIGCPVLPFVIDKTLGWTQNSKVCDYIEFSKLSDSTSTSILNNARRPEVWVNRPALSGDIIQFEGSRSLYLVRPYTSSSDFGTFENNLKRNQTKITQTVIYIISRIN